MTPRTALFAAVLVAASASTALAQSDSTRAGMAAGGTPAAAPMWRKWGSPYVGIGGGPTFFQDHVDANDDGSLSNIDSDGSTISWHLRAGFEGKYFGAEAGFVNLGEAKFTAQSDGTGDSWVAGDVSAEVEGSGFLMSFLARYPINERFALLARIGVFMWNTTETFTENGFRSTSDDSGSNTVLGLGWEYDIHRLQHTVLRTEYTRYQVDDDELPVNQFTACADYHF